MKPKKIFRDFDRIASRLAPSLYPGLKAVASLIGTNFFYEGATRSGWQRPRNVILGDTRKMISGGDFRNMLSFARQIYGNYGPARAPVLQLATYAVGTGWQLKFTGKDKKWGEKATEILTEWQKVCNVRGEIYDFDTCLFLASIAMDRCGDIGMLLTETETGYPQLQFISAHRIDSGPLDGEIKVGPYKGLMIYNGVIYNDMERAVAFRITKGTGSVYGITDEYEDISARDMSLIYSPDWVDQGRGLTAYAHAILDLQDAQDIKVYEKRGVKLDSSVGIMEKNELGEADQAQDYITESAGTGGARDLWIEDSDGGAIRYFKSGSGAGLESFKSNRASAAWTGFMDHLLRNIYAGMEWPFELAWDMGSLKGPSVRAVLNKAQRKVELRQSELKIPALRAVGYAASKLIKLGMLPKSDDWWRWDFKMPAKLSIDLGRDAMQNREDIRAGLRTREEDAAERGADWLEDRKQNEVEAEDLLERAGRISKKFNISLEMAINMLEQKTPNGNFPTAAAPSPDQETP